MISDWPAPEPAWDFPESVEAVERMQQTVVGIRELRAMFRIPPKQTVRVVVKTKHANAAEKLAPLTEELKRLAGVEELKLTTEFQRTHQTVQRVYADLEIFLFVEGVIDVAKERARMEEELKSSAARLSGLRERLKNPQFVSRAPEEVIEGERARERELEILIRDLAQSLSVLG